MASFFQPGEVRPEDIDQDSPFEIYANAVLPRDELFAHWYQYLLVSLGAGALIAGLVILYVQYANDRRDSDRPNIFRSLSSWLGRGAKSFWKSLHIRRTQKRALSPTSKASQRLSNLTTFRMMAHTGAPPASTPDSSLCILPITGPSPQKYWDGSYTPTTKGDWTPRSPGAWTPSGNYTPIGARTPRKDGSYTPSMRKGHSASSSISDSEGISPLRSPVRSSTFAPLNFMSNEAHTARPISAATSIHDGKGGEGRPSASSLFFGYQSFTQEKWDSKSPMDAEALADSLSETCLHQGFDGLVLLFDDTHKAQSVNDLLQKLQHNGIPVIFMAESDAFLLDSINFTFMDGLILQNAHVLRNGQRRDYFKAARLRDQIARVKRQQANRPEFFLGFLEIWNQQPTAAVLRRAYKLADFFGAVVEARPSSSSLPERAKKEMPLSGYDYLKKMDVVWTQKQWSKDCAVEYKQTKDSNPVKLEVHKINDILPSAEKLLTSRPLSRDLWAGGERQSVDVSAIDYSHAAPRLSDFWNTSSCGATLCPLGCFNLREEVTRDQYDEILKAQRHYKDLQMLHQMSIVELSATLEALNKLAQLTSHPVLLQQLREGLKMGKVRIYRGLDSGFNIPDNGGHFWGLSDEVESGIDIYVSQKNPFDATTIWHVFLAHHGIPRSIRFLEELHFVKGQKNEYGVEIPRSIQKELENSTESEMLYLLQQIKLSSLRHPLADAIKAVCYKLLVEKSTRSTWTELHSKACLDGSVTLRELFQMRLAFLQERGADRLPDVNNLLALYNILEAKIALCLFDCNRSTLNRLLGVLLQAYSTAADDRPVDCTTDIFSLVFFCALRKFAFEDVYLETTDRCPLFLSQHDQAGVFAELWVLGSQCEIYFGILPRALGEIIYNKYSEYLESNPPPPSSFNGKDVFTAYSNVQPKYKVEGYDPSIKAGKMKELPGDVPGHKLNEPTKDDKVGDAMHKLGALSIFCLPAIMDVVLLTFLGRGFYLTAFMDRDVLDMANYAILTALLMTGGITGYVGSTGGFYLFNYAFDNMTHFFIQRFAGAVMLTSVVGFCGFIAFGIQYGWFPGFIFVMYLFGLSTFLNLLGVLATMHRAGSPLTSGRILMWKCIPILFISPIVSTFVNGHDLLIYMLVIYTFLAVLLIRFRSLCHEWTTWQAKVPTIKEKDLLKWFKEKVADDDDEDDDQDDKLLAVEARDLLKAEVRRYHNRSLYMKIFYKVSDDFVKKMAVGHPYAMWLLDKEAGGTELPETYTATWFVQLELALGNQRQLIRGLREHSPFITFRYSKYDLGQNVGLFLCALMDRWVSIVMSARFPQAGLYYNFRSKYALCFGLLYFLLGAVSIDIVLQRYWPELAKVSDEKISDIADFDRVKEAGEAVRRRHYRNALLELLTLLAITLGVTTLLLWAFVIDSQAIILFFTYVSGYTGVLFFQFHRCFTKNPRGHVIVVLASAAAGFIVGVTLRAVPATAGWFYDYAIALNIATTSAAIGTFILTGYFAKSTKRTEHAYKHVAKKSSIDEKNVVGRKSAPPSQGSINHLDCSCDGTHKAIRNMLRSLTLDVDINVKWDTLPEDVRKFIVHRVLGTPVQATWTVRTWLVDNGVNVERHNSGLGLAISDLRASMNGRKDRPAVTRSASSGLMLTDNGEHELSAALPPRAKKDNILLRMFNWVVAAISSTAKWIAIISGAGSDVPKELWYALRTNPLGGVFLWTLLKVWKVCWWFKNFQLYIFLIAGKKPYGRFFSLLHHGAPRTLEGHRIVVESALSTRTGFISRTNVRNLVVAIFDGDLASPPDGKKPVAKAFYGSTHRLHGREEANGAISTYHYEQLSHKRWPASRTTMENGIEHRCLYDKYGRIKSGRIFRGQNEFSFEYVFSKRPKGNSEVLQANYSSVSSSLPMTMSVFWSVKPRAGSEDVKNWTPSEKIQRVILTSEGQTFDVRWNYKHSQNPSFETTLMGKNGTETFAGAPEQITSDEFGFLKKPKNISFEDEDLLIHHPIHKLERLERSTASASGSIASEKRRLVKQMPTRFSKSERSVVYRKLATSQLRTMLWKAWAKPPYLDAVSACYFDEVILRAEPTLKRYWSLRDAGHLLRAAHALDENLEQIISAIEPTIEASQTCPLLIKASDLFEMGLAKDSTRLTARPEDTYRDTGTSTSVIFSDNGCWPDNPGGVSNCRRDLVNGHTTIRGHCLAEGANDYGVPRYQIERNINSLKVLPLWGMDGKTPYHGLLDNLLQTQIDERIVDTRIEQDIKDIFVPLLKSFVRGARSRRYTREDLVTFSNVILKMNRYFETRDFNKTWKCEAVWEAWIEAWLIDYGDPNVLNVCDMMEIETPSMSDFRDALNLYICYFFIYSVEIPADCPKVFQTTHHGISSLYGILLKYRRGTTWGIWDHAILWREMCLNISPAQCLLPVPVQAMLLAGVKLACHLAYTHADIILPCTSVFNPDWEMDLGTDQGLRGSKKLFARKIDPIVNGIGNMDAFQPVKETRTKFPTTVMLSNVQFIKDVKNAVLAADVIINKFGFQDYRLTVYGAQDRQPSYALETTTLINTRGMSGKVTLAGFGSPKEVLKDAWLFMNSSLSEGLPLAIGEAALSGIPIVATEVGATALVLTDPDDPTKRYGEVVPPNDPEALARAQITLLAMLGPWTAYTHDDVKPPPLPEVFTPEDVAWITKRMYDKVDDRKALGLKLRDVVLRSFHGKRYLREHEQMYWIQRKQAETRRAGRLRKMHPPLAATFGEQELYSYDVDAEKEQAVRMRWQDFDGRKLRRKGSRKLGVGGSYEALGEKA